MTIRVPPSLCLSYLRRTSVLARFFKVLIMTYGALKARWSRIALSAASDLLHRSSHSLAVLGDHVYIFGGEREPRIPLPADILVIGLKGTLSLACYVLLERIVLLLTDAKSGRALSVNSVSEHQQTDPTVSSPRHGQGSVSGPQLA